jgi:protein ImuB
MPPARKSPVGVRGATPTPSALSQGQARSAPTVRRKQNPQRSLALTTAPPEPLALTPTKVRRLWFCVYLPNLSLEASGPCREARAVVEEQQGIHRVLLADEKAQAAGILPGQSANAALALLSTLRLEERSAVREQLALESLAIWLEQFTSVVCIAGPDVLLLEIAGSLRLYGGLRSLRQQIAAGLKEQGFDALLAIAPTPLGSTWLARAGRRVCIRDAGNLATTLRNLPLACLDWPASLCESLFGMGVRNIGDCMRLPRDGFARRFGVRRLLELDRALGRLPDPRTAWRTPETFCVDYDMTVEQSDSELLLTLCRELLQSLEQFLLVRQLGTQQLHFSFFHLKEPATTLSLGCAEADRSVKHWFDLLRMHFERLTLPEPVMAMQLRAGRTQAVQVMTSRLAFHGIAGRSERQYSITQLAERIAARIGAQLVSSVTTVDEHRPQSAWRVQDIVSKKTVAALSADKRGVRRPLWILAEPELLSAEQDMPLHQGRLTLLDGPERLETGWWDEDGIARDYYTAVNPGGVHLWVFRNRSRQASWYLHGIFG